MFTFFQHCFWDLFDFVGGACAQELSQSALQAICQSDDAPRSSAARELLKKYQGFLQAFEGDIVPRSYVLGILDALSNHVCLTDCEAFRVALNAYIRRKIVRAKKVMASIKMYQPGAKLVCRNPDRDSPELYVTP